MIKVKLYYIREDVVKEKPSYDPLDYLELNENETIIMKGERVRLYCWADHKFSQKVFEKQRNMKNFITRKICMSNNDFDTFGRRNIDQRISVEKHWYGKNYIELALTNLESDMFLSTYDYFDEDFQDICMELDTMHMIYDIMKRKHQKSLENMGLFNIINIARSIELGEYVVPDLNVIHFMIETFGFTYI